MTVLYGVPSRRVEALWPAIRPFVRRALDHAAGRYAPADVLEVLRNGRMQLWVAVGESRIAAILVTEIVDYPRQRRCSLFLSAGDTLADCLDHLPEIEAWARAQGCDAIEAGGRPGWERVLPGFRRAHVMLEKDLKGARPRADARRLTIGGHYAEQQ